MSEAAPDEVGAVGAVGGAVVRAAGGVVWRPAAGGGTEIVLVHRPRYDDWSLPKGKVDDGETWLAAAVREVDEETGLQVEVGAPLGDVAYQVRRHGAVAGKVVRYWALRATGGVFTPNEEVDELRWLPPAAATALLSYDLDREIVERFLRHRAAGPAPARS
ncbi:NUDIX hydrolase [Frankia sp. CNm7]|uniref:NUDIX hydrolase n=1 Tax=Frankia nepalensis TaxID=1836974 RepID=A0A937R9A5_9ACTN|nr:NUDIX hydrolase [Frankia nepalensis]MBL7496974.1 NUDIX hydrolase [Frankia nepalensis]MBL7511325.1 NUDIX hydrolase [Frankia nepalensis]MBL7523882.1 NUDIX hydrolase [Frankia nepalensis]MBL7626092.1 NUDIX hydrolase [Frankia nepalensis]